MHVLTESDLTLSGLRLYFIVLYLFVFSFKSLFITFIYWLSFVYIGLSREDYKYLRDWCLCNECRHNKYLATLNFLLNKYFECLLINFA